MNNISVFKEVLKGLHSFYNGEKKEGAIKLLYLTLQSMRDEYDVFEKCNTLVSFIEALTVIKVRELDLDNSLNTLSEEMLDLTILKKDYSFRSEWIRYELGMTDEIISKKRFEKLMELCNKISDAEGAEFALECYIFFRMDIMIRNPIISMLDFKDKLTSILKSNIGKYERNFIDLFKEIYVISKKYSDAYSNYIKGDVCSNCGYFIGHNDKHIWCGSDKTIKSIEYDNAYIISDRAYIDYTRPGLIERDAFDKLKDEGFLVTLYPGLESKGDLAVELQNKKIYIDCKTTKKPSELWKELQDEKYKDRIIVIPGFRYKEYKEYFNIENSDRISKIKVYDIADLVTYLKWVKGNEKYEKKF